MFSFTIQQMALAIEEMALHAKVKVPTDSQCSATPQWHAYWHSVSNEQLIAYMESTLHINSYQILFQPRHAKQLLEYLMSVKENVDANTTPKPLQSSTTPKRKVMEKKTPIKKKTAIATFTTFAPSTSRDVSANVYDLTTSSDEDIETMLASVPSKQTTGGTGSSIFWKGKEKSYSFRSAKFPLGLKYIDLKIYDNPLAMREAKPMDQWKHASFRAKTLIGRNDSSPQDTAKIQKTLSKLRALLLKDIQTYPNLESFQENL
jgi:hypothetical protein